MLKRFLFLVLFFCLFHSARSQNPTIASIIGDIKLDSLIDNVRCISGMKGVTINGVTDTIHSRHRLKPGNELAYRFIMEKFSSFGLQTDSFTFGTMGKNALAIQPGLVYANRYYIICGHYDGMPNSAIAPAADDDGSGTGAVLEAARVLSQYQFEHTIIYAIWDEEEQGLTGSTAYANHSNTQNDTILGVLNMDAIAWDGDNDSVARIHVKPIANSEGLGDTIFSINTTYNIGLDLQLNNPGATYSDHASFWNNQFSAALIIEDWDNDPNPHYHLTSDSIQYFNLPYYLKMAKLSIASVAALAVPFQSTSGVTHEPVLKPVRLYPNPAEQFVTIDLRKNCPEVRTDIRDLNGRSLRTGCYFQQEWIQLPVYDLPAGIYLIYIETGQQRNVLKLVRK